MATPIKVAAFDVDGTLVRWSLLLELIERLADAGRIPESAFAEARELKACWRRRESGFREYTAAIIAVLESDAMRTVHRDELLKFARDILAEQGMNVYVFTRELLAVVKERGYRTVAISGSTKEAVEPFAHMWGIDDVIATELRYDENGFYTGEVLSSPIDDKRSSLKSYLRGLPGPAKLVIAVGDTMPDRDMLRLSQHPIAFNPERTLKKYARTHGLPCVIERKDSITALCVHGCEERKVPRFFSEASLVNLLPDDVGGRLWRRLTDLGFEPL